MSPMLIGDILDDYPELENLGYSRGFVAGFVLGVSLTSAVLSVLLWWFA